MSTLEEQQNARFAALDPRLPPIAPPPAKSESLLVTVAGHKAGGLLTHTLQAPGSWLGLWGPAEVWDLTPVPGDSGAAGLAALLSEWRERMRGRPAGNGSDSMCTLSWPSRDAEAAAVLLASGFTPQTCLATRRVKPAESTDAAGPSRVRVRRARDADLDALVDLRLDELHYAALVGPAVVRPGARDLLVAEVRHTLRYHSLIWLAEDDGVAAGMVGCALHSPAPGSSIHGRLPKAVWGYVDTLSVAPAARDAGVGRALMAAAHRELFSSDVHGTFLFYHPANPLSPVFWHRQGYRPLWTTWARQPAWA